jgi:hypothetical protein
MDNLPYLKITIENQINIKRNEMLGLAVKKGFGDHDVLKCSQELDVLIYQLMVLDGGGVKFV